MDTINSLLTKALARVSTKRQLAARLGCNEQNLQTILKGVRHLSAAQCIALANLTGVPPTDVLAIDAIEREKDPVEKGRLTEGFFRRGVTGGVATLLILGAIATPSPAEAHGLSGLSSHLTLSDWTIYTLSRIRAALRRLLFTRPALV